MSCVWRSVGRSDLLSAYGCLLYLSLLKSMYDVVVYIYWILRCIYMLEAVIKEPS